MLELKDICFERDHKKILDHINLMFDSQKFYVITGPNGSGKSTLVKIIMGIEKPDSGQIILDGEDITGLSIDERAKLGLGFAFQQPVCFKGITVYDLLNMATGKKLKREEACEFLSQVGLCTRDYVNREINRSLSGGERKRIEIASVIARNPHIAIFDEPEAGIDLWSFQNLTEVFKQIEKTSRGITIVISHQERIIKIADEIILMDSGKVQKQGPRKELIGTILGDSKCPRGVNACEQNR